MEWKHLKELNQLEEIKRSPDFNVIFKHSTRCSISMMAKRRFEQDWEAIPAATTLYFLDLIAHRDISNKIAEDFQVYHQSPQVLLIKGGECLLAASHAEISAEEIAESIKN